METWVHKIIREKLEQGYNISRISKEFKLSKCTILREINNDSELKYLHILS